MRRDVTALAEREFDLAIVGGGIFGACAAWDAARRGLSVALIERGDFCSGTSANSFKFIHGGMRYLQHLDIMRVRESSAARRVFLRVAPHLVYPLPVVVPAYGHGIRGLEILRVATAMYDALTFDRSRGIRDPQRRVPRSYSLSRDQVRELYPHLPDAGLTGAAVFHDAQMHNPPRLVLAYVRSASDAGAAVANYVEATGLVTRNDRIVGVRARDLLNDEKLTVRARVVLNAAGPQAESLLEDSLGRSLEPRTPWSRDAFFVVDRSLLPDRRALALQGPTRDPDAILSRGERHLFLVPWRGSTLVGVWHRMYAGPPDDFHVTDEELRSFLDEVNAAAGGLDLELQDISLWNAGLIPFGENDPHSRDLSFGHRSRLVDHAREGGPEGLVTLIGVRYTTGPRDAARAVDLAYRSLGEKPEPSRSSDTPVHGGDIEDFESLVRGVANEAPPGLPEETIRELAHDHGTAYGAVLGLTRHDPSLGTTIEGSTVLRAEVVHAVREEMAERLEDVVLRRTHLGTARYPGRRAVEECAGLMAAELSWSDRRTKSELDLVESRFPRSIRERTMDRVSG